MEPNKIQDADILDIIFEGRNKDYGAYELRKTYNNRIVKSLVVMGSVVGLLVIGNVVSGFGKKAPIVAPVGPEIILDNVKEDVKPPVLPPPPVIKALPPQVATLRDVTTRIVPNQDVPDDEKPPVNDDLNKDVKIGVKTVAGAVYDGTEAPGAPGDGLGVVDVPKQKDDGNDDGIFRKVEVDASFPGSWLGFLNRNMRYPEEAASKEISGKVVVQFVVDKDGNVSDVMAVSGPEQGGLREEAVRVIKKSGRWIPAIQNGRPVKAYKFQPVIFQLGE